LVSIIPDIAVLSEEDTVKDVLALMRSNRGFQSPQERSDALSRIQSAPSENHTIKEFIVELSSLKSGETNLSADQLSKNLQSLRARMIAVGLGLGSNVEVTSSIQPVKLSNLVSYARFEDFVIVLPENISNRVTEQQMLFDFELLFDTVGTRLKWVVDCSGITHFSGMLFGNLIYHQDRLREAGKGLYVHWLHKDILDERRMEVLKKVLNLVQIGGQLFSSDQFKAN
jgi:anti-anti-sigma regulatory factor